MILLDIFIQLFGESYHWQDIVIAIISILFGFILLPQLKDVWHGKTTLNIYTASLTTIGLYILAITFFTMEYWVSFTAEIFSGTVWLLLFVLSIKNLKK
ncbi:MAG: hypothetical protein DRN24_02295 [Thermoplasmata archaeon]|nr:MAG: hypothetical protein DRN24_02295 [Thermoplasmata archaeon]